MPISNMLPWIILLSVVAFTAWWIFRPSARTRKTDFRVITTSTLLVLMSGGFVLWQSGFVRYDWVPSKSSGEVVCPPGSINRFDEALNNPITIPRPIPSNDGDSSDLPAAADGQSAPPCDLAAPGSENPLQWWHTIASILASPVAACCGIGECVESYLEDWVETDSVKFCTEPINNRTLDDVPEIPSFIRHVYACVEVSDFRDEFICYTGAEESPRQGREFECPGPARYCLDGVNGGGSLCNRLGETWEDGQREGENCQATRRPEGMLDDDYAKSVCCMMKYFEKNAAFDYRLLTQNCGSVASLITECLGGGPINATDSNLGIGCSWGSQNFQVNDQGYSGARLQNISGEELCERMKKACVCRRQ